MKEVKGQNDSRTRSIAHVSTFPESFFKLKLSLPLLGGGKLIDEPYRQTAHKQAIVRV